MTDGGKPRGDADPSDDADPSPLDAGLSLSPLDAAKTEAVDSLKRFITIARREGVSPLHTLAKGFIREGMDKLDEFFEAVAGADGEVEAKKPARTFLSKKPAKPDGKVKKPVKAKKPAGLGE